MKNLPDLRTALLDLIHEITDTKIIPILGGGFGIFLRIDHLQHAHTRTLLDNWPEPRATNDLDLFLRPELLIDATLLSPLAKALDRLGYNPVPAAANYQFEKPGIKIDILTGPQKRFLGTSVKVDARRARPNPSVGIHAHPLNAAITLEEGLFQIPLQGLLSSGKKFHTEISLPHPYTYLLMKLFAFRDRLQDPDKAFGSYHALDLYSILATTTEHEWKTALELKQRHEQDPAIAEASRIVSNLFSQKHQPGILRLKESPYYRNEFQLEEFISALQELFIYPSQQRLR